MILIQRIKFFFLLTVSFVKVEIALEKCKLLNFSNISELERHWLPHNLIPASISHNCTIQIGSFLQLSGYMQFLGFLLFNYLLHFSNYFAKFKFATVQSLNCSIGETSFLIATFCIQLPQFPMLKPRLFSQPEPFLAFIPSQFTMNP